MPNVAICPSCKKTLSSVPTRKKKCEFCGEYIFVRNHELVTKEQADKYDLQQTEESKREWVKTEFSAQLEKFKIPKDSSRDQIWRVLNKIIVECMGYQNISSCMAARYAMACQSELENNIKGALEFYLCAFYIEANIPGQSNEFNRDLYNRPIDDMMKYMFTEEYKNKESKEGGCFNINSGHIRHLCELGKKLGIPIEQLKSMFFKNLDLGLSLKCSPEYIWTRFKDDFEALYKGEQPKFLAHGTKM
jgi:hypothetical protein